MLNAHSFINIGSLVLPRLTQPFFATEKKPNSDCCPVFCPVLSFFCDPARSPSSHRPNSEFHVCPLRGRPRGCGTRAAVSELAEFSSLSMGSEPASTSPEDATT